MEKEMGSVDSLLLFLTKNLERCTLIRQPHTTDDAVFSTISPAVFTEQLKALCWLRTDSEGSSPSSCYM